ncbi:MAG: hypothetical protein GY869_07240 [Planctomycetes bacterium]|nr:hypothetical protein [Planctomycetota bacterium]
MGMDVFGNNGNYFRANIWTWPAIMSLVAQTEVLPQDLVHEMQFNNGVGPNARQAKKLADALEKMIEDKPDDQVYHSSGSNCPALGVAQAVRDLLSSATEAENVPVGPDSEYESGSSVDLGYLREFIQFCRQSGGFRVC